MKNNDVLVSSLPVKPQNITNVGMMMAPTVMNFIGDALDCNKMISFNTLHSYSDKEEELDVYLHDVKQSGISYDKIFIDSDNANKLLGYAEEMYYNKQIIPKNKTIVRCDCGKVDLEKSAVNGNAKLYSVKNGKIICNHCNSECKEYNEDSLVLEVTREKQIAMVPNYLNQDINSINQSFLGKDILISKGRDTNYSLSINGRNYNIDIDFLWSNYFKLFDEKTQIYIASNHQLFAMFYMNYIASISSKKNLIFVATPYLNVDLKKAWEEYSFRESKEYKSLLLLYNMRWRNKNCNWSESVASFLSTISDTKLKNLYKSMIMEANQYLEQEISAKTLNEAIDKSTNMQNNIKVMKRYYKEGLL